MIVKYNDGMTVAELKKLIVDWPETDEYGEPCTVWLSGNGYSNVVTESCQLNARNSKDGSFKWSDLLLSYGT